MPKYLIEREIKNVGNSTEVELKAAAITSNKALNEMGSGIHWVESYVTNDKFYCIYIAKDKDQIIEHGKKSGFPVDRIEEIRNVTGPERGL